MAVLICSLNGCFVGGLFLCRCRLRRSSSLPPSALHESIHHSFSFIPFSSLFLSKSCSCSFSFLFFSLTCFILNFVSRFPRLSIGPVPTYDLDKESSIFPPDIIQKKSSSRSFVSCMQVNHTCFSLLSLCHCIFVSFGTLPFSPSFRFSPLPFRLTPPNHFIPYFYSSTLDEYS